jgi:phosphatidylglycerol:prolipoprotein diacylglycerol transferase
LLNLDFYLKDPLEIIKLHHGGLAIFGGILAATIATWIFAKSKKIHFLEIADLVIPYVALGESIGRIGCFLNGCCYGLPCKFGLYFTLHQDRLIPTQLISSLALLFLYIVLRNRQDVLHSMGIIFADYIIFYSVIRFLIEFLRGDSYRLFLNLTIFQYFCLVFFAFGLMLFFRIKWKRKTLK